MGFLTSASDQLKGLLNALKLLLFGLLKVTLFFNCIILNRFNTQHTQLEKEHHRQH